MNKRIVITGSGGFVGKNLYQLLKYNYLVLGIDKVDKPFVDKVLYLSERKRIKKTLDFFKPDTIIHLAGLVNADICEKERKLAYKSNVLSTKNLTNWARRNNARIIYISSDYVYDGVKGNYTEEDTENPLQYYGQIKLECEKIVSTLEKYIILRPTVIYDWDLEGVNFFMQLYRCQMNKEKKRVPIDQISNPTFGLDLCNLIKKIIEKPNPPNGKYIATGEESFGRYEFAVKIFDFMGWDKNLLIPVKTSELEQIAKRPLNNSTSSKKVCKTFDFNFNNLNYNLGLIKKYINSIEKTNYQPLLSICILTHNRAPFLKECLDNITCQFTDQEIYKQVQVVISDNASSDNTEGLVKTYQEKWENIKYFRNNKNLGFDKNILNIVDKARGEYCWLLGDDDALFNDALKTIVSKITLYRCSYYICNWRGFDHELRNKALRKSTFNFVRDQKYDTVCDFIHSIKNHKNISGYFSGLSNQIFKRKLWNLFSGKEKFIGSQGIYFPVLLIIMKYERFCLINKPLVKTHSDNIRWETFEMSSLKKRLLKIKKGMEWVFNMYDIEFSKPGLELFFVKEFLSQSFINFVKKYLLKNKQTRNFVRRVYKFVLRK